MAIVAVIENCLHSACENSRTLEVVQAAAEHDVDALAALLKQAAAEHHTVEYHAGKDDDWADWYARFMLGEIKDARTFLHDGGIILD